MKFKKIISIAALAVLISTNSLIFSNANTLESTQRNQTAIEHFDVNSSNENQDYNQGITPKATLLDQYVTFRSEGQASFTYRGGRSLEVTLKNTGSTSFKWRIVDPKGNLFHTGTLAPGKGMKSIYPDFDTPNGRYTIYAYNNGGLGQFSAFVRNIEY